MLGVALAQEDSQRIKVYEWEREMWDHLPGLRLTIAQCQALVNRVYDRYNLSAPSVIAVLGRGDATGNCTSIRLPRWALKWGVVLHEAAHGLAFLYAPRECAHGPTFVRIYTELLHTDGAVPRKVLRRTISKHNLQIAPAQCCSPDAL